MSQVTDGVLLLKHSLAEQYAYWILSKHSQQVGRGEGSHCHLTTTPDRDIHHTNHWYPSLSPVWEIVRTIFN